MGTDIHLYIEKRDASGKWQIVLPPEPPPESERTEKRTYHEGAKDFKTGKPLVGEYDYVSPFWGPGDCFYVSKCYGDIDENGDEKGCRGAKCGMCQGTERSVKWYRQRNYDVFAILTGTVRNGHGFAGCDTGEGFRGITAEPRGVPKDISKAVKKAASWDHSESWLTLAEVLAYDWDQVTVHRGVIPMNRAAESYPGRYTEYYEDWRDVKPRVGPKTYSGDISGPGIHVVDMPTADRLLAAIAAAKTGTTFEVSKSELDLGAFARGGGFQHITREQKLTFNPDEHKIYVRVAWTETYRESASDFLAFVEQYLVPLAEGGDAADVRLVFGFDS